MLTITIIYIGIEIIYLLLLLTLLSCIDNKKDVSYYLFLMIVATAMFLRWIPEYHTAVTIFLYAGYILLPINLFLKWKSFNLLVKERGFKIVKWRD